MSAIISAKNYETFAQEALDIAARTKTFTNECKTYLKQWKETAQKAQNTFMALQFSKTSAYQHLIRLSREITAEKEKGPLAGNWLILERHRQTLEKACNSITAQLASASIALTALQEFKSSESSDVDDDSSDDEKGLPAIDDLTSPSSNSQNPSTGSSTPPSEPEEE